MTARIKCARELLSLTEQLGLGAGADIRFVLDPTSGQLLALGATTGTVDSLSEEDLESLIRRHREALLTTGQQTAGTLRQSDEQPVAYAYVSRTVTLNDITLQFVELISLPAALPHEEPAVLDASELPSLSEAEVQAETRRLSMVMAPDGRYLDVNDVGMRLFNQSRDNIIGRHAGQVLRLSGQEIRRLDQSIQATLRGQPQHLTWWYRAPQQATPITADIALRPVRYAGQAAVHTLTRLLTDARDPVHAAHLRNSQLELANFILTSANQFQRPTKLLEFVLRQLTTKAPVSGGALYGYNAATHQLRRLQKIGDTTTNALPSELNVKSDSSIVARLNRRRMRVAGRILAAEFGLAGVAEQTLAVLPVCSDDSLLYVLLLIIPTAATPQYGWTTALLGLISDGINSFVTREQLRVELAEERQTADEAIQRAEVQRQSARELRNLLGSLSLAYVSFDREATILAVNDFFVSIVGYAREELLGRNYFEVFVPEETERHRQLNHYQGQVQIFEEIEPQNESTIVTKSGERLIMRWNRLFERDQNGRITATISIGRDVTAGVLALEDSQRNRARFQDLFDNAHDLIQHLSPDNRFLLVNRAWHETLGYSDADVRQLSLPDIVHPYYSAKLMHQLRALYRGEDVGQLETVLLTKGGRPVHLIGSVSAQWQDGQVVASRLILHDITERIQAERLQKAYYSIANLAISARDLDTLYGAIHRDLSRLLDTHNLFITLCDESRTRLTLVYVTDQRAGQGNAGDSRPFGKGAIEYIIRGGHPQLLQRTELEDLTDAGILEMTGPTPEVLAGVPLAVGGRIIGALVVVDYTNPDTYKPTDLDVLHFISSQVALAIDRKRNELQLNRQNARLNAIFESGSHLMWSVSPTRQLTAYNRNFALAFFDEDTAPNAGTALSVSAMDLTHPLDLRIVLAQNADMWEHEYAAAFSGEARQFEVSTIRPDGSEAWAEIYLNPILLPDGTLEEVSGIAHDITEKKLAELELARQEELFRGIFESFQDVYYRTDVRGRLVLLSPSVEANFGFIAPDLIGRSANTFFADPNRYQELLTLVRDEGYTRGFEADFIDHTGQPHAVLINARRLQNAAGEAAGMEGLVMDISPLKQVQQALLVAKQDAEAALHAKTQFLANMSHELRTPMNGIIGMIELLQHSVRTPQQIEYVETLRRSSDALLAILNDILDLSKIQAGKLAVSLAPVDLADVLAKVRALFANRAAQKHLSFTSDIAIDVPRFVQTDETRLLQILSNLTANAIKFTSHGGVSLHLTLAYSAQADEAPGTEHPDEIPLAADSVTDTAPIDLRFEVVDSGIGIAADDATRLFTDFTQLDTTSTKAYGGTGLGLSISRQLADLLGGTIGVRPNPAGGSVFWFTIHCRPADEAASRHAAHQRDDLRKRRPAGYFVERPFVMLVDDNTVNQTVSARLLEHLGCRVRVAPNGFEALRLIANAATPEFALIFMDIQMPELDGTETTQRLRRLLANTGRPCPPVVAMTAYSMPGDEARFRQEGFDDYVSKPITSRDLFGAIRRQCPDLAVIPSAPTDATLDSSSEIIIDTEFTEEQHDAAPAIAPAIAPASAPELATTPTPASTLPLELLPDPLILQQLVSIGGDEFVQQLFADLIADSVPELEVAAAALAEGRISDMVPPIHQLKGASAQLGLTAIAALALIIEQAARQPETTADAIEADFVRLHALFTTFAAEYHTALPSTG